jgi:acyl dehydratase
MTTLLDRLSTLTGQELGPTAPVLVDQARIDAFADVTLDHQWIHVDVDRAAAGPFGTTIVHGYLTLSLLVKMVESLDIFPDRVTVINYGIDKLRYPAPVPSGSSLSLTAVVKRVDPRGEGRALMTLACTVSVPGAPAPALVADVLYLFVED